MSIHFVSTTVLSSEDGLEFGKETAVMSEDAQNLRENAERSNVKPLAQVLAERKAQKEEEYDATGKSLRAPQVGLDEDDMEYFRGLDHSRDTREQLKKTDEELALEQFRKKRKVLDNDAGSSVPEADISIQSSDGNGTTGTGTGTVIETKTNANNNYIDNALAPVITVRKRRRGDCDEAVGQGGGKATAAAAAAAASSTAITATTASALAKVSTNSSEKFGLALLGGYGSDSDSDSDSGP